MYHAIVFLPIIGALIVGLNTRRLSARDAGILTSALVSISAILSWVAFYYVCFGEGETSVTIMPWIHSGDLAINWAFKIDALTAVMLVVVNTVSALVHIYSIGYMHHDPHQQRFFAYLSLFTFAMLMLVTADNLVQMFFGWEGVGLASYLLIGFWYHKSSANAAAIKAFVVNRVGDFGFALGIFALFMLTGSVSLDVIFEQAPQLQQTEIYFLGITADAITIICLLLFLGAMGKSAQFLLHTWLPDAMEGPTPVSALIHAATMVTAGVFMVARLSPLYEYSVVALTVVTTIGAITALFAATVGLVQNDIKRVIAYSTCSQLGYMFVALGTGAYTAGVFHLFTHAFFKALLFLGSGSVIHAMSDEQDMRKMGGLRSKIPMTFYLMLIGTIALTGFPLTAGYYSKDMIIEAAYASDLGVAGYAFFAVVLAAGLTSFYSWRLMFMTFFGKSRASKKVQAHIHESPPVMLFPLYVLAAGALLAGFLFSSSFVGGGLEAFWSSALFSLDQHKIIEDAHHVPTFVKYLPLVMMLLGFAMALLFYVLSPTLPDRVARSQQPAYQFLLNKWYFDEVYDFLFVGPAKAIGRFFWKKGDGWLIDGFGPNGLAARAQDIARFAARLQTGKLYHYAFALTIGITVILSWFILSGGGH